MRYSIVIEKAATGLSAFVPDLSGCIAKGAKRTEVQSEMKGAIRFHIDGANIDALSVTIQPNKAGISK